MGCTPSIHVSQTGVVYCRESDDSAGNSPTNPDPSSRVGAVFSQKITSSYIASSTSSKNSALTDSKTRGAYSVRSEASTTVIERRGRLSLSEAETQTAQATMKVGDNKKHKYMY